jgi:cyclopropane fatty-acyl-phospholipid synthase-like methyltransferase
LPQAVRIRACGGGNPAISYIVNKGADFDGIADGSQTAVFSYDAMVHFELSDVAKYLVETFRILRRGGMALYHHSNAAFNPGATWSDKPGGRNFMSADIFAHLAMRAGLRVVSQNIIAWGVQNLDCLSLVKKD